MYPLTALDNEVSGSSKTRTREEAVTSSNRKMQAAPSEFSATEVETYSLGSVASAEREERVSVFGRRIYVLISLL